MKNLKGIIGCLSAVTFLAYFLVSIAAEFFPNAIPGWLELTLLIICIPFCVAELIIVIKDWRAEKKEKGE